MCFPRGAATPDVTIKLKLGDNMFGFCHRKRGGHDCAEARSCGGEGCPISKEMLEAGLISLRRMKEGQKARIAHVQASGELGRRIRDMGLIPGAEVEVVGRAPLRDPVALRLPGFTLSLRKQRSRLHRRRTAGTGGLRRHGSATYHSPRGQSEFWQDDGLQRADRFAPACGQLSRHYRGEEGRFHQDALPAGVCASSTCRGRIP